ncbi:hypothetical protein HP2RS_00101, partial [Helicobacter pylori]
MKNNTAG